MAEYLVSAASATLSDCIVTATATVTEAVTASGAISTAYYDAVATWALKVNTIAGIAVAGVAIAGFEIIDL